MAEGRDLEKQKKRVTLSEKHDILKSVPLMPQVVLYTNAGSCQGLSELDCTHREKGMDDVSLDRAEWLVSNHNKDLLLFLQADEVTEPGPLSQSANTQVFHM